MYTKHEETVLIEKKLKKAPKGTKKRRQEVRTCEKMDVSKSEESGQCLDDTNESNKSTDSCSKGSNVKDLSTLNHSRNK